jgi:hypothetical protein
MLLFFCNLNCKKESIPLDQTVANANESLSQIVEDRASCNTCTATATISGGTCPTPYQRRGGGGLSVGDMLFIKGWTVCSAPAVTLAPSTVCVQWKPEAGTIRFSAFSDLRTILNITSTTIQAHHLIPERLCNAFGPTTGYYLHPVVAKAARDGYHPCDGYSGIAVASALHTPGGHQNYTNWVEFQLKAYNGQIPGITGNPSATNATANTWIQCKLIPKLRTEVNNAIALNQTLHAYFGTLPQVYIGN